MDAIEYNTWIIKQEYFEQKLKNAKLENDYWQLRVQKLKDGED